MRVRITKSFASATWDVSENEVADVTDEFGRELIRDGLAVPETPPLEAMALKQNRRNSVPTRVKTHVPAS
jgi:hypothetical protein